MTTKRETRVSPSGVIKYCHLDKPDTRFDPEGKFSITLVLDMADEATKAWAGVVDAYVKKKGLANNPVARERNDKQEVEVTVKFASAYKPKVFGPDAEPMPPGVLVGNGSTVKVAYESNQYEAFGGGVNFYLKAVQVLVLKEYTGRNAESYGFTKEQEPDLGFPEEERPPDADNGQPDDDNLPF